MSYGKFRKLVHHSRYGSRHVWTLRCLTSILLNPVDFCRQEFSAMFWILLEKGNAFTGHYLVTERPPTSLHSVSAVTLLWLLVILWFTLTFHFDLLVLLKLFIPLLLFQKQKSCTSCLSFFPLPREAQTGLSISHSWHYHWVALVFSVSARAWKQICVQTLVGWVVC